MSIRFGMNKPPYPVYDRTPVYGGNLPSNLLWPPDTRPSALNPSYSLYEGARDRNFAGLGDVAMQSADPGMKDYPNELNALSVADDVDGNGIFDPNGSPGNIHADYGVFSDHESLPGYIARDQFYRPSEVVDATTGAGIMYVPAGAVAIDASQLATFRANQLMMEVPPGVSPRPVNLPEQQSIVRPQEWSWPLESFGAVEKQPASAGSILAAFAIAGVAIGLVVATVSKPKRRSR